jgi:hypothetical protein|tara:strand:- start:117 stop:671 length:555 start_codon:yes stop_codon:yes gene_type:complete
MRDYLAEYYSFALRGVIESFLLVLVIILFLRYSDLLSILKKNKNYFMIFIIFIFFNIGQITDRFQYQYPQQYDTYPFIRFAMYQASPDGVELVSYRFCVYKNTNQNCEELNVAKIYSAIGLPPLSSRMNYLVHNFPDTSDEILLWLASLERLRSPDWLYLTFEKEFVTDNNSNYIELRRLYVEN